MTEADIAEVLQAFEEAARRAARVGFDGIQIHAAAWLSCAPVSVCP